MNHRQRYEDPPGSEESCIGPESLENLRDDARNHRQVLFSLERCVEARHVRGLDTVEEIRPGVRVNEDHALDVRAERQESTSPSQASFPRRRRSAWYKLPFWTKRRRAISTASRLDLAPVRRLAFSTSASSISMLVRPMPGGSPRIDTPIYATLVYAARLQYVYRRGRWVRTGAGGPSRTIKEDGV